MELLLSVGAASPPYDNLLRYSGTDADVNALRMWLASLKMAGRTPPGMKDFMPTIRRINDRLLPGLNTTSDLPPHLQKAVNRKNHENIHEQIRIELSRWTKDDVDFITKKLAQKEDAPEVLKLKHATYHNKSNLGAATFKKKAQEIDKHLGTLRGFHAIPLGQNLTIWFVRKELSRTSAKYVPRKDLIYILPDRRIAKKGYGTLPYVITHELAHRVEHKFRSKMPPVDFDKSEWWTTQYSRKDTVSGGEAFAELFALSHWKTDYPEYRDTINRFIKTWKR